MCKQPMMNPQEAISIISALVEKHQGCVVLVGDMNPNASGFCLVDLAFSAANKKKKLGVQVIWVAKLTPIREALELVTGAGTTNDDDIFLSIRKSNRSIAMRRRKGEGLLPQAVTLAVMEASQ